MWRYSLNVCNLHALPAHWNAISIAFKMHINECHRRKLHHGCARGLPYIDLIRAFQRIYSQHHRAEEKYIIIRIEKRKHDKI